MKPTEFKKLYESQCEEIRKAYEAKRKELRRFATQVMYTRMVADNIADIIPKGWQMVVTRWGAHIELVPPKGTTLDVIDKEAGRLARKLNREPNKDVRQYDITISFYLYPSFMNRCNWLTNVAVVITTSNTEQCEVEVVEVLEPVKKVKLTGYCKVLAETKYLKANA